MPSALTFGRLNAPNRALLVHGLSASSLTWHRVGPALATAGYYVTCPDLLNHGFGGERSGDCSVAAFGEALFREYYQEGDCYFDLIVAHSLGGPIVAYLLDKLFSEGMGLPDRVVLVDPAMEMQVTRPLVESYMDQVGVPAHVWQEQNPTWTWMDCLVKEMGNKQISVEDVRRIFQVSSLADRLTRDLSLLAAAKCPMELLGVFARSVGQHQRQIHLPGR
jgi:pimeloyl-ACP methyl ester carboxylesterase